MKVAEQVHNALKIGKYSAWIWWNLSDWDKAYNPDATLMNDGVPGPRYYALKQYYRYVRPGAVQIESSSNNASILTTAFKHEQKKTTTIVMVNKGGATSVTLSGANLPASFNLYRSSSVENCVDKGSVSSSSSIQLPASSVTTLHTPSSVRVSRPAAAPQRKATPLVGACTVKIYGMDGRLVGTFQREAAAVSQLSRELKGHLASGRAYYFTVVDSRGRVKTQGLPPAF